MPGQSGLPVSEPTTATVVRSGVSSSSGCTLRPTGSLTRVTVAGPGPGGSTTRTYELYVPEGIGTQSRVPLLVSLHGLGASGTIQNAITHWSAFDNTQAAAGTPFILVLPDGLGTLWFWGAEGSYDVRFIFDVIARLEATGCVDPSQVYLDGWSEGAYMAQRMACAAGDPAVDPAGVVLAGVAAYAGGNPALPGPCGPHGHPVQAVPILMSQGLADRLVDPARLGYPGFAAWAPRYGCQAPSDSFQTPQQLQGCRGSTAVDWWPIEGFGHVVWSCPADPTWHNRGIWAFLTRRIAPTDTTCT
jgi:polyhydroxybutyrate depolymerase